MNKFYYFSKSKLQLVEVKNHKLKLALFLFSTFILSFIMVFGGFAIYYAYINPPNNEIKLRRENAFLKDKLIEVAALYDSLDTGLDSLRSVNNELRVAANLRPLTDDEYQLGTGGGSYDNLLDFLTTVNKEELEETLGFIEEVERKFEFQKSNFDLISSTLERNEKLFSAIPAIKPAAGNYARNGFGMRLHPILKVYRMHNGIDIIGPRGTPVYASGDGVVDYVGRRGGFGNVIEIKHGFGYRTIYAHLSKFDVSVGQKISRGDMIGKTGSSGLSTGPHLHYEVLHNGKNLNPSEFIFDDIDYFLN